MSRRPVDKYSSFRNRVSPYRYAFLGIELGVSISLGVFVGLWFDRRWATGPWFLLLFMALGIGAGFRKLLLFVLRASREEQRKKGSHNRTKGRGGGGENSRE